MRRPRGGDHRGPVERRGRHPVQDAFIRHDAFQCGYCTPGRACRNHVIHRLGVGRYTVERRGATEAEEERPPGVSTWQPLRTRTTTTTFDAFGNPDLVVSATTGGRKLTEDPTYGDDTAAC